MDEKDNREACQDLQVKMMLQKVFGTNTSAWNDELENALLLKCPVNESSFNDSPLLQDAVELMVGGQVGRSMYSYLTPFIILVGIVGHGVSLIIFTSPSLRRLSASLYLAAISICDILVLLTYVMLDWFKKGLPHWPGEVSIPIIDVSGFCQVFLFLAYAFRFISVWLIVVFTVERYIAVCRPLHRRLICTKSFSRRVIVGVTLAALAVSLYKPLLSGVYQMGSEFICAGNPSHTLLNRVLDAVYGLLITAVPFLIITFFNLIILRRLLSRDMLEKHGRSSVMVRGNLLRLEFTAILLAISTCFVCLNIPYFVLWFRQVLITDSVPVNATDALEFGARTLETSDRLYLTKVIFYINYCANFFLYCLTGRQYREQIKGLFASRPAMPRSSQRMHSFSTQHSLIPSQSTALVTVQQCGNGFIKEKVAKKCSKERNSEV